MADDKTGWGNVPELPPDAPERYREDAIEFESNKRLQQDRDRAGRLVDRVLGRYDDDETFGKEEIDEDDLSNFNSMGLRRAPRKGPKKPLPMPHPSFRYNDNEITGEERERFLEALSLCGDWNHASHSVGRSGSGFRKLATEDPMFSLDVQHCAQNYRELLHQELVRRIFVGDDVPVCGKDEVLGWVTKRSDRLLEFELEHRWPQLYNSKYKAGAGDDTGRSGVLVVPEKLQRGEWSEVAAKSLAKNTAAGPEPAPRLTKKIE